MIICSSISLKYIECETHLCLQFLVFQDHFQWYCLFSSLLKENIYIYMKIDAQNVVALVVDMHSDFKNKYAYVRRWLVSSSVYHLNQNKGKIKKF